MKLGLKLRRKRVSRSAGGDFFIFTVLAAGGIFMALPLVYAISQAFKPLNEFFLFPPQFFVRNPTMQNFHDLFLLMAQSWVPISRYFLNSVIIIVGGTVGHIFIASLAAYALSKHKFPGDSLLFGMIVLSLMFTPAVTRIPNYLTMSYLGWVDTYAAIIIPGWGSTLGLYLMRQFMVDIPESYLEAARIDGAGEFRIFWRIVMPIVKPAWLTLIILLFQQLWRETGGRFIYTEQLKTLPYALNQIVAGGVARRGVGAAVMVIMMLPPVIIFMVNQSKIIETMGTSGLD